VARTRSAISPNTLPSALADLDDAINFGQLRDALRLSGPTLRRYLKTGRVPQPDLTLSATKMYWRRARLEDWLRSQAAASQEATSAS